MRDSLQIPTDTAVYRVASQISQWKLKQQFSDFSLSNIQQRLVTQYSRGRDGENGGDAVRQNTVRMAL